VGATSAALPRGPLCERLEQRRTSGGVPSTAGHDHCPRTRGVTPELRRPASPTISAPYQVPITCSLVCTQRQRSGAPREPEMLNRTPTGQVLQSAVKRIFGLAAAPPTRPRATAPYGRSHGDGRRRGGVSFSGRADDRWRYAWISAPVPTRPPEARDADHRNCYSGSTDLRSPIRGGTLARPLTSLEASRIGIRPEKLPRGPALHAAAVRTAGHLVPAPAKPPRTAWGSPHRNAR
jgi:hypothetical protein